MDIQTDPVITLIAIYMQVLAKSSKKIAIKFLQIT